MQKFRFLFSNKYIDSYCIKILSNYLIYCLTVALSNNGRVQSTEGGADC